MATYHRCLPSRRALYPVPPATASDLGPWLPPHHPRSALRDLNLKEGIKARQCWCCVVGWWRWLSGLDCSLWAGGLVSQLMRWFSPGTRFGFGVSTSPAHCWLAQDSQWRWVASQKANSTNPTRPPSSCHLRLCVIKLDLCSIKLHRTPVSHLWFQSATPTKNQPPNHQ